MAPPLFDVHAFHEHSAFSDRFIAHMLQRHIRIEEDLVDQLFNSSEKRGLTVNSSLLSVVLHE